MKTFVFVKNTSWNSFERFSPNERITPAILLIKANTKEEALLILERICDDKVDFVESDFVLDAMGNYVIINPFINNTLNKSFKHQTI
jgi:hypothetical protein